MVLMALEMVEEQDKVVQQENLGYLLGNYMQVAEVAALVEQVEKVEEVVLQQQQH